jgi:hypothetical protein
MTIRAKPKHRAQLLPGAMTPRWARPKLDRGQLLDIELAHLENLDGIHAGEQNVTLLWHLVEAVFTWSKVAELLKRHEAEMALQLEMATRVVERYGQTGRVEFDGLEYQVARRGVGVMNELARATDVATAQAAATWSELLADALRASSQATCADAMARGLAVVAAEQGRHAA